MPLTTEQREFLKHAYDLHLRGQKDDTAVAAGLVRKRLKSVPESEENREYRGELIRMAVVLTNAAAGQERELAKAFPLMQKAVDLVVGQYPIGPDAQTVADRELLWNEVYGGTAQVSCLRDILHVIANVVGFDADPEILNLAERIKGVIYGYAKSHPQNTGVINFVCEEGSWSEAKSAYKAGQEALSADEKGYVITMARLFGRAVDEQDWAMAKDLFSLLIGQAKRGAKQSALVAQQIGKNYSSEQKKARVKQLHEGWQAEKAEHPGKYKKGAFVELHGMKFVDLGGEEGVTGLQIF